MCTFVALNFTVMGCRKLNYCVFEKSVQWETPLGKKVVQMWLSVDPLFSKYPGWSPYNYALCSPIRLIDPNGMEVMEPEDPPTMKVIETRPAVVTAPKPEQQPTPQKEPGFFGKIWNKITNFLSSNKKEKKPTHSEGRGGAMLTTNKEGSNPQGPGQTTDVDVPMTNVDVLGDALRVPGASGNPVVDGIQMGCFLIDKAMEIKEKVETMNAQAAAKKYQDEKIVVTTFIQHANGSGYTVGRSNVARKDSAATVKEIQRIHGRKK